MTLSKLTQYKQEYGKKGETGLGVDEGWHLVI